MLFVWIGIIVLAVIVIVIAVPIIVVRTKKADKKYKQKFEEIGFNTDIEFSPGIFSIFVDEAKGLWCLKHSNKSEPVIYKFDDLAGFEMYEYGMLSGKVYSGMENIGLLKFGYAGQENQRSKDIILLVKFKNDVYPPVTLKFIGTAMDKDSELYTTIINNANEFVRILTDIIKKSDSGIAPAVSVASIEEQQEEYTNIVREGSSCLCSRCGAELVSLDKFCIACGAPVMQREERPKCPRCGTAITNEHVFCALCGYDLRGVE